MKTIFEASAQQEILQRLEKLSHATPAKWGKMNVSQMITHCSRAMRMPTGDLKVTPSPLRFIGQFFKKKLLGTTPLGRNSPTAPEMVVSTPEDFDKAKASFLEAFGKLSKGETVVKLERHPFFNKMTPAEWGRLNYKHIDHHFQQFGV